MSFRSWSASNLCPVCSGHRWSGASAEQCRGGLDPERSALRVWCSIDDSGKPSSTGTTWEWWLDAPYPWRNEPKRGSAGFRDRASTLPGDLFFEGGWERTARWIYRTAGCEYAFEVARFDHEDGRKSYRPGRATREGSEWVCWGLPRHLRIVYQLPRLLKAIEVGLPVYIVEGEKSADAINDLDIALEHHTATTMPGGASQWNSAPEPQEHFAGAKRVTIVADRDVAGEGWAHDVVRSIHQLDRAPDIRLVRSRTMEPGDDVVEHLGAGFSLCELKPFTLS